MLMRKCRAHRFPLAVLALIFAALWPGLAGSAEPRRFDISRHGAVGDGKTVNTRSIQAAIDRCAAQGGGTLVVPRGEFVTGSIFLKPGVNLQIQEGGVLKGSPRAADYPVTVRRIAGAVEPHRWAMINAAENHGLRISGPGTLDGNNPALFAREAAEAFRKDPIQYKFPQICFIKDSNNVTVSGVKFKDAAFWNLHFYRCAGIRVENSRFQVHRFPSPSSDGIDLDSSRNAVIRNCFFSVDDDCIALKGTRGRDATKDTDSPPTENIYVSDCTFEAGHGGVTLGSEGTFIRNVRIERCTNRGKMPMLRLKIRPDTPGQVYENIRMSDITLDGPGLIVNFGLRHGTKVPATPPGAVLRNVRISKVRGAFGGWGNISGNATTRVSDFHFQDIDVTLQEPKLQASGVKELTFRNVVVNGRPVSGP